MAGRDWSVNEWRVFLKKYFRLQTGEKSAGDPSGHDGGVVNGHHHPSSIDWLSLDGLGGRFLPRSRDLGHGRRPLRAIETSKRRRPKKNPVTTTKLAGDGLAVAMENPVENSVT